MKLTAIIPAAGSGKRAGTPLPKQYLKVNGKELLAYTLEVFQNCRQVHEIIVAVHPDYIGKVAAIKKKYGITKLSALVIGGKERQDSVEAALAVAQLGPDDLVAVHDAARPLLPAAVLQTAITHAKHEGSALVAMKAKDTLLHSENNQVKYLNRDAVYYVQTPQIFRFGELTRAFSIARKKGFAATDESMMMRKAGYPVSIVEGSVLNFKVTTREDLAVFKQIVTGKK